MCCHDISMVMSFSSESILYEYIFRRWTFTIYIFSKFDFLARWHVKNNMGAIYMFV